MEDLKKRVEALLFSSGKRMHVDEIAKICNTRNENVSEALNELKKEYDEKDSSLILIQDNDFWKLTVRNQYMLIVQKIVTETELSKTVMETLAVIAFKYPILQSELIKIRTNKAYEHLSELEELGYITRQKHGRTKLIKLTDKFFEYFDLPQDKLKEQFKDFESIAKAIEEKEHEIVKIKEEQRKKAEEAKKDDERIRQAAEDVDKEEIPFETYESEKSKEEVEEEEKPKVIVAEEKLDSLEVVEEPSEEELEKERERIKAIKEEDKEKTQAKKEEKKQKLKEKKKSVGIKLTDEMEKEVDKRVEEILHPKEESEELEKEAAEDEEKEDEAEEAPKDLLEAAIEEEKEEEK